ncbi:transcriptional regulator [Helicobacter pylori]|nr:transcriptional regulator [Helicobacter pylori]
MIAWFSLKRGFVFVVPHFNRFCHQKSALPCIVKVQRHAIFK